MAYAGAKIVTIGKLPKKKPLYLLHQLTIASTGWFFAPVLHLFVIFVVRIGAFVEDHVAIAFERKDVCAYTVEEPAVVAYDDSASGKIF